MSTSFDQIENLIEMQKKQAEKALQLVMHKRASLLKAAEDCLKVAGIEAYAEEERDLALVSAIDKWQLAQRKTAASLVEEADALEPEIHRLIEQVNLQLKKQSGLDELAKIERKKQMLALEEKADEEILSIIQLGKKRL